MSSQSGALGLAMLDYARAAEPRHLDASSRSATRPTSRATTCMQYWAEDPRTDVILLYLESFGNPGEFSRIARRVGRRKPIVAVKAGRSRAGARARVVRTPARSPRATRSSTRSSARPASSAPTRSRSSSTSPPCSRTSRVPRGRRVAIVTNAGGPGHPGRRRLRGAGTRAAAARRRRRPPRCARFCRRPRASRNPVDMLASAPPEHYERTLRLVLADPNVDSVLTIFIPPIATDSDAVAARDRRGRARRPARSRSLAIFMSARGAPPILQPIPSYAFPEPAAIALARAVEYGRVARAAARRRPGVPRPPASPTRAASSTPRSGAAAAGSTPSSATVCCPRSASRPLPLRLAADPRRRRGGRREELGFPVVLKAVGPAILHKTEVGGVRLGLATAGAVREAAEQMSSRIEGLTQFLVQPMVTGGVEVIVGVVRDPTFGPLARLRQRRHPRRAPLGRRVQPPPAHRRRRRGHARRGPRHRPPARLPRRAQGRRSGPSGAFSCASPRSSRRARRSARWT